MNLLDIIQSYKLCAQCQQSKPMSAFVIGIDRNKNKIYGTICQTCRGTHSTSGEKKTLQLNITFEDKLISKINQQQKQEQKELNKKLYFEKQDKLAEKFERLKQERLRKKREELKNLKEAFKDLKKDNKQDKTKESDAERHQINHDYLGTRISADFLKHGGAYEPHMLRALATFYFFKSWSFAHAPITLHAILLLQNQLTGRHAGLAYPGKHLHQAQNLQQKLQQANTQNQQTIKSTNLLTNSKVAETSVKLTVAPAPAIDPKETQALTTEVSQSRVFFSTPQSTQAPQSQTGDLLINNFNQGTK